MPRVPRLQTAHVAFALGLLGPAAVAGARCADTHVFDVTGANLAIFGVQYSADYLGPAEGTITGARAELRYQSGGSLDPADLIFQFQAPSDGVPVWQFTGADLGWSGTGTFQASISTDELDGVIDLGDPPPDFSLFLLVISAADFQPLAGQFINSSFEVDVVPPGRAPGDVTGDGVVDVSDLVEVILAWGQCPIDPKVCAADLDCNGVVDVSDLVAVILNWG